MADYGKFPLVTGHPSLDLVNTEVVRRGARHDLLATGEDLGRWVETVVAAGGLHPESLPQGYAPVEMFHALLTLRDLLRRGFEKFASGEVPEPGWKEELEALVGRAPMAYKVSGEALVPVPQGRAPDAFVSLIALDALNLLAAGELRTLRRCANPDCVLLFMDASGRRKWCSMKLCGNRMKVARHQSRKEGERRPGAR